MRTRLGAVVVASLVALTATACDPPVHGDHDIEASLIYYDGRLAVGATRTVSARIANKGSAAASGVEFLVVFPAQVTITSPGCSAAAPGGAGQSYILCEVGDVAAGTTAHRTITVVGASPGDAEFHLLAGSDVPDSPDGASNHAWGSFDVSEPWFDLLLEDPSFLTYQIHTVTVDNMGEGRPTPAFTYTATWSSNISITRATAIGYRGALPTFTQVSCSVVGQQAQCAIPEGMVRWTGTGVVSIATELTVLSSAPYTVTHQVSSAEPELWDDHPNVLVETGTH